MKRRKLLEHLNSNGCVLFREGSKHIIFYNPVTKRTSSVPRHAEINDFLVKKICKDLGIKEVS
ncbi:MAG TPA: type II toxin-antitoxin system HicA family toxin [Candidatus Aenigmarchaeota archaeon]|nr:type II toxin-antitoxin system HicA family toxin [Candidatus Aenigmarchaeota archaeon]